MTEISYIIVSYNSEKYISKCIESVLNQSDKNFEIIVVDNSSTDNTKLIVQGFCIKNINIKLISNMENVGYANAITTGCKNSHGEFLAILNADSYLDKEWTNKMLKIFKLDNNIMSASGTIFFPDGQLQTTGGMMDRYGAVVQRNGKVFNSRNIEECNFFYNDGSCFMIRRKILEKTSLDPHLFLYYEDVDLSWKILMLGYKIEYVKEAISFHDSGQSIADITPLKFYFISRNRLYMCMKNYSARMAFRRIPVIIFLIFLNSIVYDFSKKPKGYLKFFFKAIFWNISHLKLIKNEQKKLRSSNKMTDEELNHYLVSKSIEFAYIC